MSLASQVAAYIALHSLLAPQSRILAAVSGGPDSLCMLSILDDLGYDLTIAHFDHRLRADSGTDADAVRSMADRRHLPCIIGSDDVSAYASQYHKSIEEAARILRYKFLGREALTLQLDTVAVGHTADDQAETILMHLLRGTGPAGLRGMLPSTDLGGWLTGFPCNEVRIVRPLLGIRRSQSDTYCKECNLNPIMDPTNRQPVFWRNRIRNELIPQLEAYNPQTIKVINRMADIMKTQVDFVDEAVNTVWGQNVKHEVGHKILVDRDLFKSFHKAVQQGVIRRIISELRPSLQDVAHSHIDQAISFFYSPPLTKHINLVQDIQMSVESQAIVFFNLLKDNSVKWNGEEVTVPGLTEVEPPGWQIICTIKDEVPLEMNEMRDDEYCAYLDFDQLQLPLRVLVRSTGDLFDPLGMDQIVRLSNFMSAQHMPKELRNSWPLIGDGKGIIWVPGYRIGKRAKISNQTTRYICLKIHRPDNKQ